MLMPLPVTGDWVEPTRVLRVQISDDLKSVHVVTDDGAQMTIPLGQDEDVHKLRDDIANEINHNWHRPWTMRP